MSSFRVLLFFLLFFIVFGNTGYSQNDSNKILIGPEDLQNAKGGHYFNFADKNKVNIEVTILGTAAGRYLIPQGTTLFELLLMGGVTNSYLVEKIKLVRFSSETPALRGSEVLEYSYIDLYGDNKDILKSQKNPVLRPGDMIILPETKAANETLFYLITQTISFVGTLVSFYYLIDNIIRRNK